MAMGMTIIVADDHPLFRGAMRQALAAMPGAPDIVEAGDFGAVREAAARHPDADLLMLDLTMPGISGFSGLMVLRTEFPSLPILIVSAHDEPATITRSIDLGACGFLSKSAGIEDIRRAIDTVIAGNLYTPDGFRRGMSHEPDVADLIQRLNTLTPQQSRVLAMLAEGLLNKQIAYELGVSEATIKAHVSAILLKLNVDSRTQAVIQLGKVTAVAA
ncbi:response regulator transcription factor [Rhizobium sp. 9140]|uniref:response regulator transcription factor n=1 Tax=Rhizobium sp. 9140 TaxID=1761900 RepID=UPI000793892A|nr:response regulator transcription factor [Rhizobium sp. 9140]CZT34119.1 DNA-binding response regulator, NarL/FixJ family, contains REC and HTH domains [Rhizobium sp. 9140]